jgi:shikimate kinase
LHENLMIIVTGAPGAGKTTLSKNLAGKFNLPVINKDEIKELLFFLIFLIYKVMGHMTLHQTYVLVEYT